MGRILNKRLLLKNNRLLFSLLFIEIFVGTKALIEGHKVVIGGFPHCGKPWPMILKFSENHYKEFSKKVYCICPSSSRFRL